MPNFYSLNITNSGSLRLYNNDDDLRNGKGFVTTVTKNGLEFKELLTGTNPVSIIQISSSNREARFGVGFGSKKFEKTFDILSSKDDSEGTEILLRSSRTSTGAQPGDIAGKVSFAIQSGSYSSVASSGSAGSIRARVDEIDEFGVIGSLILSTPASKYADQDTLTVSFLGSTFSSSLSVLANISSTGTVEAPNITSTAVLQGNEISASTGIYTDGDLYVGGLLYTDPPPGDNSYGIEFREGSSLFGSRTDERWTLQRTPANESHPEPSGLSIALTGSLYHSGSYLFDGGTIDWQNVVFSLGGFTDVSSSLANIDAGVF